MHERNVLFSQTISLFRFGFSSFRGIDTGMFQPSTFAGDTPRVACMARNFTGTWCKLLILLSFLELVAAQIPILLPFDHQYGPDGPWQALRIRIGGQEVDLYPGSSYFTKVLSSSICEEEDEEEDSECIRTTLYDEDESDDSDDSLGSLINYEAGEDDIQGWGAPERMNLTGEAHLVSDNIEVNGANIEYYNVSGAGIIVIDRSEVTMPDDSTYETQVGFLGLGMPTPATNRSDVVANSLTGGLRADERIPSNSVGLHIGSAFHEQPGSLVLGGYDRSRVIGPVGTWDVESEYHYPTVELINIAIDVETGASPFEFRRNDSFLGSETIPMVIDPTIPYIHLPFGMCEEIASHLPVNFLEGPGLYAWDTGNPSYQEIVQSPANLAFTFREPFSQNLTIRMPFSLLNLTLESPIVDEPTPYFPCKPSPDVQDGRQFLGRAFLQAAYFAIDWEAPGIPRFFLAQAPGPDFNSTRVLDIRPETDTLESEGMEAWAASWSQTWTVLDEPEDTMSSLDPGAIAGIVLGGLGGVIVVCFPLLIAYKRMKKRIARDEESGSEEGRGNGGRRQSVKDVSESSSPEDRLRGLPPILSDSLLQVDSPPPLEEIEEGREEDKGEDKKKEEKKEEEEEEEEKVKEKAEEDSLPERPTRPSITFETPLMPPTKAKTVPSFL